MDTAHRLDGERRRVVDVAVHDPLEAVTDADDFDAFELAANGGRGDDAVDAGRGPSGNQYREARLMRHTSESIIFEISRLACRMHAPCRSDDCLLYTSDAADE